MKNSEELSLLVVGPYQATEAYPNTLYRLQNLRERFAVCEINEPGWSNPNGGLAIARSPFKALLWIMKIHFSMLWLAIKEKSLGIVYIPYPALGMAVLFSLLPKRWQPKYTVLDGFISVYDTVVNDRQLWRPNTLRSRLLWRLERHAFQHADKVLVDTPQNADFYTSLFQLPNTQFMALPLATNEHDYVPCAYQPVSKRCTVLFIGTLVPLHGIEVIAEAARLLADRPDIQFRILGDGADAAKLENVRSGLGNLVWQRRWHSAGELAREIAEADICLGIFGTTEKTQRVCPYKLYAYASVGRATITGDTAWLRSTVDKSGRSAFLGVAVGDATALAEAIKYLADKPLERSRLAQTARDFYDANLTNTSAGEELESLLIGAAWERAL